jgi:hypothetical protein
MYECDTCVKGKWYCENKCSLRPPQYSPTKQQEFLREAIESSKCVLGEKKQNES